MQAPAITRERLRELSRRRAEGGTGLSLIFDLDPERFATPSARGSEINSVLDEARRRVEGREQAHEAKMTLRENAERAESALSDPSLYDGAHGLAVFAGFDGAGADPVLLRLPRPAGPDVDLDTFPLIRPLLRSESTTRWCVALVSREEGRILLGDSFNLANAADLRDEVQGRHDQGGWSQARYQRAIDEDVREHHDAVAGALGRIATAGAFDALLLAGTDENVAAFRDRLPEPVARAVAGTFAVDVSAAGADDVLEAARGLMEQHEERVVAQDLERLNEQLGTGDAGAMGLGPVLEALNEQRVARLFAPREVDAAGTRCPRCDRIAAGDEAACPLDGAELNARDRILDDAVRKAAAASAEISIFETAAEIPGGIAALTHY